MNKVKKSRLQKFLDKITDDKEPDYSIFYISSILIITSIIFSYSLSIHTVVYFDYDQFHFFVRQLFAGVLAILIMWSFAQIKPDILLNYVGWSLFGIFFLAVVSMQILPASFVTESGGARRWIRLPFLSISPVEFFKIGFIYFIAFSFDRKLSKLKNVTLKDEIAAVAPYFIPFGIAVFFIAVKQKDLGNTVLLATVLFVLLAFSSVSKKLLMLLASLGVAAIVLLIAIAGHRIKRILEWWSSVQDSILPHLPTWLADILHTDIIPKSSQVSNSLDAMYNGGFFGTGLGEGALKLGFLSEVHTDFVLAGITEEIGLVGLFIILSLLFLLIYRIFRVAKKLQNNRYHLFTIGIGLMISIALIMNSYGIASLIPIKGIAVPFLSYGGSSILASAIAVGLVLSISREISSKKRK